VIEVVAEDRSRVVEDGGDIVFRLAFFFEGGDDLMEEVCVVASAGFNEEFGG